jgi:hypothetical protein
LYNLYGRKQLPVSRNQRTLMLSGWIAFLAQSQSAP